MKVFALALLILATSMSVAVAMGDQLTPTPPTSESVDAAVKRLEELHRTKQGNEAYRFADELIKQDRKLAAEVISIVLHNREIESRTHLIDQVQRAKLAEAIPALTQLLDEPDAVGTYSARALGELGDPSVIPHIERRLRAETDELRKPSLRIALAQLGRPYSKYLISGLSDRDVERRRGCMAALETLKEKRAVPYLLKIMDESTDTWEPVDAARSITGITGIDYMVVTKLVKRADGSVNGEGKIRPRNDVKADGLAWIEQHRDEVSAPLEESVEQWNYTPEPFLPGLSVAFSMDAKQVKEVYRRSNLEFQYKEINHGARGIEPARRTELIEADKSCLDSFNDGLTQIAYVFENNRLEEIRFERIGRGDSLVAPLATPLKLRKRNVHSWSGLDGTIIVERRYGDAEKETLIVRLRRWGEATD